jgi:excisionase family DNA binding protein
MFFSRDANADAPLLYGREEACRILGISLSTLKLLVDRGEMREITLGKRRLVPRAEIERLIEARMAEAGSKG